MAIDQKAKSFNVPVEYFWQKLTFEMRLSFVSWVDIAALGEHSGTLSNIQVRDFAMQRFSDLPSEIQAGLKKIMRSDNENLKKLGVLSA